MRTQSRDKKKSQGKNRTYPFLDPYKNLITQVSQDINLQESQVGRS